MVEVGAVLIIGGRGLELLEATEAQMRGELGGRVAVSRCDIREGAAVDSMMETVWREAPLDVLRNPYPIRMNIYGGRPRPIRAVTHYYVTREQVGRTIDALRALMTVPAGVSA